MFAATTVASPTRRERSPQVACESVYLKKPLVGPFYRNPKAGGGL
jgi:hypothetical protein